MTVAAGMGFLAGLYLSRLIQRQNAPLTTVMRGGTITYLLVRYHITLYFSRRHHCRALLHLLSAGMALPAICSGGPKPPPQTRDPSSAHFSSRLFLHDYDPSKRDHCRESLGG